MKLLIFTYAPAGLGHLRVTDALVDSRPKDYQYIMLGSYDRFITWVHRFFSNNLIAKWIFTISQYGLTEDFYTTLYRFILVHSSKSIYKNLLEVISRRKEVDEVWVIATHFGMAHQIGAVKERLIKETGVKIKLIVQVTDDTSQHIWCVRGADLTFVPSLFTKEKLERYSRKWRMNSKFEVIPYPICPVLTKSIGQNEEKRKTAFASDTKQINVSVPISGAAVGLSFITKLIKEINLKSSRFHFWVLAKKSLQTEMFLSTLTKYENVHLVTGRNDNEMISLYELLYQNNLMHLEITKPSEQSFKGILTPDLVGGSLLLFTNPVGRQEFENINFLKRQGLMPGIANSVPRAIRLPRDAKLAADLVLWGLNSGLFVKMSSDNFKFSPEAVKSGEVGPDGAYDFWKSVDHHFG